MTTTPGDVAFTLQKRLKCCAETNDAGRDRSERQKSRCGDEMMRVMLYEAARASCIQRNAHGSRPGPCRSPASWNEESDRGTGAPIGRDHAPHMG